MKIIDNIANKLYLGVSKLPGAGVGLFAGIDILAGKPICEYKGEVLEIESASTVEGGLGGEAKLSEAAQKRLGEKYAYTLKLGFDKPSALYAIGWQKQSSKQTERGMKMIDCQPSLTDEEMGLGGFINDKRGPLERTGEEYEKEQEARSKVNTGEDLKAMNELDISLGYNCTYWSHPTEVLVYVLSIRDIKAGEEIYVNYGHLYWIPFLKKIKEDKEIEEAKAKEDKKQPEATTVNTPEDLVSAASENVKNE